jgi:hypothetical protein
MPPDFASQMQVLSNAMRSMVHLGRFAWATDVIPADRVVEELKSCEKLDDIHIFYEVGFPLHSLLSATLVHHK